MSEPTIQTYDPDVFWDGPGDDVPFVPVLVPCKDGIVVLCRDLAPYVAEKDTFYSNDPENLAWQLLAKTSLPAGAVLCSRFLRSNTMNTLNRYLGCGWLMISIICLLLDEKVTSEQRNICFAVLFAGLGIAWSIAAQRKESQ